MESMNELLEKYFRGETTLTEELLLKSYFATETISPEHEIYRSLFIVFEEEKSEILPASKKMYTPQQRSKRRFWIKTISYSGIAAAFLLTLWLQLPIPLEKNYTVISGIRIENEDYTQKYAEKKLNKAAQIIANGMKPLEKVSSTREKMHEIENKLPFK